MLRKKLSYPGLHHPWGYSPVPHAGSSHSPKKIFFFSYQIIKVEKSSHAVTWSFRLVFVFNSGVPTGVVQVGSFFPLEWTVLAVILVNEYMTPAI